jgi:hypothetical protein
MASGRDSRVCRELQTARDRLVAWPLATRAQRAMGMRRVAFLHPYSENDTEVLVRRAP